MSVLLRVAYDGTGFSGFARQADRPDGRPVRTVQAELEAALAGLYGKPVATRGASRTDAGVHAQGQLVSFEPPLPIPPTGVAKALSDRLPDDMTVSAAWHEDTADVRRGNEGKHYRYRIRCTRASDPQTDRFAWPYGRRLDVAAMQDAASLLVGEHDFGSFRSAGCQAATTVRRLHEVTVRWYAQPAGVTTDRGRLGEGGRRDDDWVEIDVHGRAFLYNMVRILVGSLVEVGAGRRDRAWLAGLLQRPDRRAAGPTAPARGLTLVEVHWPSRGAIGEGASPSRNAPSLVE